MGRTTDIMALRPAQERPTVQRTLLILATLGGCASPDGPANLKDSATSEPTVATTTTAVTTPLPANISDVLDCDVPEPSEDNTGTGSLHILTLDNATARCNDGSPPVAHLRTATHPDHQDDWIITLEGGGECDSHEKCLERWCGTRFYDVTKMNSRYAKTQIRGQGIHSSTMGEFQGWNHVRLYYCSSDMWTGTHADSVLDGDPPFSLHFEGARILDAFLDALDNGVQSDDETEQLDSLSNADILVFGGTSGGAWGAMQQLDMVAERYPNAHVVGMSDAILYADVDGFAPEVTALLHERLAVQFELGLGQVWQSRLDASCLTDLANTAEPWRCADQYALHRDHISTSYAVNRDLGDPTGASHYVEAGATLIEYADVSTLGERALLEARPDISVRGPACRYHSGLFSNEWFHQGTVQDSVSGQITHMHDSLLSVIQGAPISAIDTPEALGSVCP